MTVKVYDSEGASNSYEADTIEIDADRLWVKKGNVVVSVYADGKWINADIIADE